MGKKDKDQPVRGRHRNYYARQAARQRRHFLIAIVALVFVISAAVVTVSLLGGGADEMGTAPEAEKREESKAEEYAEVSLIATGDNLIHNSIYQQAQSRAGGSGYDFSSAYAAIAPIVAAADIAFINQETPVASRVLEVSSYPSFNTPVESVEALVAVGFNAFNLASNHTIDKGTKGMAATIDFMNSLTGIVHFGAYRDGDDLHTVRTFASNGIVFAFIGITEMTNGLSLSADTELRLVYNSETETIQKMIGEARAAADVVVVSVHWGDENVLAAADRQKLLGQQLANWGADLIIGHHPHVLQQIEVLRREDGTEVPIVYSLGNFISAQRGKANMVGGFLGCTVKKQMSGGSIKIEDVHFIPTVTQFGAGYSNIHVVPYDENYTAEMASSSHGLGLPSAISTVFFWRPLAARTCPALSWSVLARPDGNRCLKPYKKKTKPGERRPAVWRRYAARRFGA